MKFEGNAAAAGKYELTPYAVTVLPDPTSLSSLYLELDSALKLLLSVKIEENKELDSTFELSIDSKDAGLQAAYRVYTNALTRLVSEVAFLDKYKKTRFVICVNIVQVLYKTDILAHIVNALTLTLLLARIELRYLPVASTVFIDDSERLYTEAEANRAEHELTRVYLCKKLSNDDEIVAFAISGGHINDKRVDGVLAYLVGSANTIGRRLLEFTHALATN